MVIDLFTGYDTLCAGADLESKFAESGLGLALAHEKKDFSHGRFSALGSFPPDLGVCLDGVRGAYSGRLLAYFEGRLGGRIVRLATDLGPLWGDLGLTVASNYLARALSVTLGYDMSRPGYEQEALRLYRYGRRSLL